MGTKHLSLRQLILCLFIFFLVGNLAGCSGGGGNATQGSNAGVGPDIPGNNNTGNVARSTVARETSPLTSDADMAAVVGGNTGFALKAFTLLDTGGDANAVFSPYSITQALALAAAGAKGTTLSGIEQALSFTLSQDRLNPAFNKLDLLLKSKTTGTIQDAVGQTPHLNVVNAVWGQQGFQLLPTYLDTIALNFGADLRLANFITAPENSRLTINTWVEEQTNKKIIDLIPPGGITAETRLVLTNAIWFKANWASPFQVESTQDKPFYSRNGSAPQVPFMRQTITLPYAHSSGCQSVDIPYAENKLSMMVIMPDTGTIDAFLSGLTPAKLGDITSQLGNLEIDLSLPKFTFNDTPDFNRILQTLGMVDAYNSSKANFSGIDGERDLLISNIMHKAFISVDEKGTEAAAATAINVSIITSIVVKPPPLPVIIDHPFIFLIRDRQTGLILFMGKVVALLRNPFFLDSESGFDWTVNPEITGHCFSPILPAVSRGFKCPIQVFFDSSFRIESPFIENVI